MREEDEAEEDGEGKWKTSILVLKFDLSEGRTFSPRIYPHWVPSLYTCLRKRFLLAGPGSGERGSWILGGVLFRDRVCRRTP